jgi:hypothetical protein
MTYWQVSDAFAWGAIIVIAVALILCLLYPDRHHLIWEAMDKSPIPNLP